VTEKPEAEQIADVCFIMVKKRRKEKKI